MHKYSQSSNYATTTELTIVTRLSSICPNSAYFIWRCYLSKLYDPPTNIYIL